MIAPIDQQARERIERELDVSLCVEAGAGTGKTTVLVGRVVALLRSGRVTVDGLAVITFTEKAAAELSARVRFELERALEDVALTAEERERILEAIAGLYRARIQTIHAFAADLLRERPVEARLDPQFETQDDLVSELGFEAAYRRWLDRQLAQRNEPVERAMRRGFDLAKLRELVDAVHRHREVLPLASADWSPPEVREVRVAAADWATRLTALRPRCGDEEDKALAGLEAVVAFCAKVVLAADDTEVERLALFEAPKVNPGSGRADAWGEGACAEVKEICSDYKERVVDGLAPALRTDALVGLLPLAQDFALGYAESRRREGVADFDDLLIWARDLLRDQPTVRDHFARRTPRVLVDEFQDTDPVQAELIAWLCAPPGALGDWREVVPRPGSLFVVGDPKQSIYRFRGADIAVYDTVKQGPLGSRLEHLTQNFRSSRELLGWMNGVFDRVLQASPGVQPPNVHLHGELSMARAIGRSPVVALIEPEPGGSADERRDQEFEALARALVRAVGEERWPVRDRRVIGEPVREARWQDVAVLVPSRTGIERLEAALQRYGVPYRLEGGRGFFTRQEVRDLVSLLHAVDDPTDAIALVATLRSLAFGCSDEDLLGWALEHRRWDYRPVGDEWAGPEAVREAMATLRELHYAVQGLSLAELVREAIERTGLVEAALSLPAGPQSAANVMKLLDHAREFSAAGSGALRAFTAWLGRMRDREEDEIDAPVAEERDDAVRVMTIHAAKGLEFPIVCLANLNSRGSTQTDPVPDAGGHGIELKVGGGDWVFCTPGWDDVKARERAALEAERDRLLYVACTRARDHLVVGVCFEPGKPQGPLARLAPSLPVEAAPGSSEVGGVWAYDMALLSGVGPVAAATEIAASAEAVSDVAAARAAWLDDRSRVVEEASHGVVVETATGVKVDPRPLAAQVVSGADEDAGPTIEVDSTPPLELGDAFHRVMEQVELPDGEGLEELAGAVCAEAGIPESVRLVVAMARRCLASEPVQRAAAAGGEFHREMPFVVGDDADGVLVGRIDLLYRDVAGGLLVVDYKTDLVTPGEEADAALRWHGGQVEAYRRAVREALGAESRVLVVFARTGAVVEVA